MDTAAPLTSTGARKPSQAVAIRDAGTADLPAINTVVDAAIVGWDLPERVQRLAVPSLRYTDLDLHHMVVRIAEVPAGAAVAVVAAELDVPLEPVSERERLPGGPSALLLHGLYVVPSRQREGIGAALLARMTQLAREEGVDGVLVRAWREADRFFLGQGFVPLGEEGSFPRPLWRSVQ